MRRGLFNAPPVYNPGSVQITGGRITGVLGGTEIIAQSGVDIVRNSTNTAADATEFVLASYTLPVLGANDAIEVMAKWKFTGSAVVKQVPIRLYTGSVPSVGLNYARNTPTTGATIIGARDYVIIWNRGVTNSQICSSSVGAGTSGFGTQTGVAQTLSVQTNAGATIDFCALFPAGAVAGETITLEAHTVRVMRGAS